MFGFYESHVFMIFLGFNVGNGLHWGIHGIYFNITYYYHIIIKFFLKHILKNNF